MKPFDLQKALKGEPILTRNGKKVLQIAYFNNCHENYNVIAHIENELIPLHYSSSGYFCIDSISDMDLFMKDKDILQ